MANNDIYKTVLNDIVFLYRGYSKEHRGNTQPFQLEIVKKAIPNYTYDCKDLLIRESLIEHTGSLPIVATAIYPYINNPQVDLGRALIMLAIHDIGELVTGDEITFIKKKDENNYEKTSALKLLPKQYHRTYLEMEERRSDTARFAKAIDKIAPDILDLITPAEITIERYKLLVSKEPGEIVSTIKEFKHPYTVWNDFLSNLHLEILGQLDNKLRQYYGTK